jgi:hypothetical protein
MCRAPNSDQRPRDRAGEQDINLERPATAAGARGPNDNAIERARALSDLARALEARVRELEARADDFEGRLVEIEEALA